MSFVSSKSVLCYFLRYRYNHYKHPISQKWGRVWAVFCEFKVWEMFVDPGLFEKPCYMGQRYGEIQRSTCQKILCSFDSIFVQWLSVQQSYDHDGSNRHSILYARSMIVSILHEYFTLVVIKSSNHIPCKLFFLTKKCPFCGIDNLTIVLSP